jgi:hypothetical protein
MANVNIANVKAPKAPNLPIPTVSYSQTYFEVLTNVLRLYFNQLDLFGATLTTPDIGYYLNQPYGGFSDSTTQTPSAINTPIALTLNTSDIVDGPQFTGGTPDIYIDPTYSSRIVILYPGVYNVQFSLQLHSTNAAAKNIYIWLNQNGTPVPNTASRFQISGSNNEQIVAWNFLTETFTSGEYIELMWQVDNVNIQAYAVPATATIPAIPSLILTVTHASA